MQNWINFLRGSLHIEVTGAFPERFLNLCAQTGVIFWGAELPDLHTLHLHICRREEQQARQLAQRAQCQLEVLSRSGLPHFLHRFRRRYALLLGLGLSLCAVAVLSRFILTVEVSGNERVPTARILEEMERLGVRPGAYGPSLNENLICHEALLELDELSWISVNLHGTVAEVLVAERTPKPEVVDESIPAHIVASAPGIITRMQVLEGQAKCEVGDTVAAGDILISGVMDLEEPQYSTIDMGTLTVRAAGSVQARTWRTLSAVLPLDAAVKTYTGVETTRWSAVFFSHRLQFYKNGGISYGRYDKIADNHTLTLPGGRELPLSLSRETLREYTLTPMPIDPDAGAQLLSSRLEQQLEQLMEATDGQVVSTNFTTLIDDGMLTVYLQAECLEQIGETLEFDGEIGRWRPGSAES